ncbi:hypothetical protein [Frankia sp. R82]|uniref:hypothetical protein n=1 Tax=Frankia sp. R82 TaxID=2950553 RepID=UPI00204416DA|nr:hypothetical protein [Frankia sp. R82]MCM3886659.1 hypothetical protein [Frankia sp. R82]
MIQGLVVALCLSLSMIIGLLAGILAFANGTRLAGAMLAAGSAFLLGLPVTLSVATTLEGR